MKEATARGRIDRETGRTHEAFYTYAEAQGTPKMEKV
jgi:hypothetical protein